MSRAVHGMHPGRDRGDFVGRDAYLTLAAHAPRSGEGPSPRWITGPAGRPANRKLWTLVGLVLTAVAIAVVLVDVTSKDAERYTMDTATSRGTANAYFAALQRGDDQAALRLTCEHSLYGRPYDDDVRRAFAGETPQEPMWELGPGWGGQDASDDTVYYDFLIPRKVRGTVSVERDAGGEWRVCLFHQVGVWVESPE